jgi:hypothetical protein
MGVQNPNSTSYVHPDEPNLLNIHKAMTYDPANGEPHLRVTLGSDNITVSGNVNLVEAVRVNNTEAQMIPMYLVGNVLVVNQGTTPWVTTGNANVTVIGNVSGITTLPAITGNVGVSGNVSISQLPGITVTNFPSNVRITDGSISVTNFPAFPSNVSITQMPSITGNVWVNGITGNITGITTLPAITGNVGVSGNVSITQMPAVTQGTDPWQVEGNVAITGTANVVLASDASVVVSGFSGAVADAFGRLRVSEPFTLFDTQSRYYDHGQFSSATSGTANVAYIASESSFSLTIGSASGDSIIRETKKVFPYQPGKSQLTLNTFCFATPKTNLRQRVGLFGADNGVYFENDGTYNYMVIRSGSTGVEERVRQDAWNGDRLDGSGSVSNSSGTTLYPNRTQIFYADVEWLGVGSVRTGFVINGAYHLCHTFHHANQLGNTRVYMTTATLPIRYEITNTSATTGSSTMKQICSTVISEGGYNGFGTTQSAGTDTTQKRLTNSNTYYPVVSIKLNSNRLDSIVLPRQVDVLSPSVNYYRWILLQNATLTGATWATTSPTGTVDIDTAATAVSGGIEIQSGYAASRELTQLSSVDYFQYQLGRTLAGVSDTVTLAIAATANNADLLAEIGWQELT